ncbi:MAG TPA: C-terminal helicase domain-containing protein, partial [Fimbriimonadaceae bacterium]|nr:C-terminal helicase domain-containing protein [Fimbriimonadaceae bacterium]
YEAKKLGALKEEIKFFGVNETIWLDSLEADLKELGQLVRGIYEVTHPETDAKLKAFVEHIRKSPKLLNDKFVLFTEFKDTARYLEQQLKRHFPNDNIVEVDSGRNVGNRESVIKRFAPYYNCENDKDLDNALKDPIRILISTDVLSEGLNLQDANIIVNYDLHWNPVRLMQRIGRVDRRMDPSKPVDYDRVYVYNFLPPAELNQVVDIYNIINDKLIVINRAIGIEAPVLTAKDDFKAQDYYLNLGEGTMSTVERLRLKAHELSKQHPELWQKTTEYPNRIYSGKASPSISGRGGQGGEGGRYLFLCYRLVTGYEPGETIDQTTRDARWVMVNRETGEITEDLDRIHEQIECAEGTLRKVEVSPKERTRLRKVVENELIDVIRYRSQIPDDFKDELVCWMEVG